MLSIRSGLLFLLLLPLIIGCDNNESPPDLSPNHSFITRSNTEADVSVSYPAPRSDEISGLISTQTLVSKDIKTQALATHKRSNMAFSFSKSDVTANSSAEAINDYRKSAEQGDACAQFLLGSCYYRGKGVDKNLVEAVKWYRKSAEQGDVQAQLGIGVCYYNGWGIETDFEKAAIWFRKAAEQGDAHAQFFTGICYANGYGVSVDNTEAYKWYLLASIKGDEHAIANRQRLEQKMSTEQIAAANRAASRFEPKRQIRIPSSIVTHGQSTK